MGLCKFCRTVNQEGCVPSALVPNIHIKYRFYFHLAHLREEGQRCLDPALNAKLGRVPCVTWESSMIGTVTMRGHVVRLSFVLVGGWCLRREKLSTTGEGSWLAGGPWPAIPRTSLVYQKGQDGRDSCVFQSSYTVMNEHNLVVLQVSAAGNEDRRG